MSGIGLKVPLNTQDHIRSINIRSLCCCVIRKARILNVKLSLLFVVLCVCLLLFMMIKPHNGNLSGSSLLNITEAEVVNISMSLPHNHEEASVVPGLLLLLIHASGKEVGKERRDAIRATWASDIDTIADELDQDITYKFVLGSFNMSAELLHNLTVENNIYQDMIFLPDVPDTHASLTLRTLRGFEYYKSHSMDYQYVLKCDDDTFINLKTVATELKQMNGQERLYWGEFYGASHVITDGIYAEYEWYQCETYVPYAYGGGYVLSRDLVELIATNAPYLRIYKNEDVSVGAWLAPYGVKNRHDGRFNTGSNSRGCKRQFIISHKITSEMMYSYFASLNRDGYFCSRKNRWYGWRGHTYNWKRIPSKCCRYSRRIP